MAKRYLGNTGQVRRMEEPPPPPRMPEPVRRPPAPPPRRPGLFEGLGGLLPGALETEDLLLLLVLYLLYRESGDSELLLIMGAMFLL